MTQKLPNHDITLIIRPNGNHVFGAGEGFDARFLAETINEWPDKKLSISF